VSCGASPFESSLIDSRQDDPTAVNSVLQPAPDSTTTSTATATTTSVSEVVVTLPPSTSTTFSTVVVTPTFTPSPTSQTSNAYTDPPPVSDGSSSDVARDTTTSSTFSSTSRPGASPVSTLQEVAFPSGSRSSGSVSGQSQGQGQAAAPTAGADAQGNQATQTSTPSTGLHLPIAAIIGGAVGVLVLITLGILFCMLRRRNTRYQDLLDPVEDKHATEGYLPTYMPPVIINREAATASMHTASTVGLLDPASTASVPAYDGTPTSSPLVPSVLAEPVPTWETPQTPLRVVSRPTDRLTRQPSQAESADVATLASAAVSFTTEERVIMRERVDILQSQVERLVAPRNQAWEDLPPAYDQDQGASRRGLPRPPPSSFPADIKFRP
jgi:hypothetical protein